MQHMPKKFAMMIKTKQTNEYKGPNRPIWWGLFSLLEALLSASILFVAPVAFATDSEEMPVKVTIKLCPEYRMGNVSLKLYYSLGEDPTKYEAKIRSVKPDESKTTAQAEILLPRAFGSLPINVQANCESTRGESNSSNQIPVSNCDYLALIDSDKDGIPNAQEDTDCSNFFNPGDKSNPDNFDTDGDGVRDLVEVLNNTDPTNPGSSPRPYIFSSAPFDPDGDKNSNPVVWRPTSGNWFIKDYNTPGNNVVWQFGLPADIPFTYTPNGGKSDVGVIRRLGNEYQWYFHGPGFETTDKKKLTVLTFGIFGDNITLGNWESSNFTSPGVARLVNNHWYFYYLKRDGSAALSVWGGNGDIPKVQDYDGDGIFDVAVYRPSTATTYVIRSTDHRAGIYHFGTATVDHTVRGDVTGDSIGDIVFWEPLTTTFTVLKSDSKFDTTAAQNKSPAAYFELKLGTYFETLPLSWNYQKGLGILTVIDHQKGIRSYFENNDSSKPITVIQWGLAGDAQG